MAKQASRKSSVAKKPVGRKVVAAPASKAKSAKSAVVAAKPKASSRPVVSAALPKAGSKTNGTPASKSVSAKPAVVSKTAKPVVAPVAKSAPVSKPAPVKSKAPLPMLARKAELPPPRPIPIPEAVPTNGKPRKNQAGLSSKELEHFRDLLLEKRRELVGDMYSMESEALRTSGGTNLSTLPLHMADMGTDNYEQEFTLGLVEKDRGLLREINASLAKIQNGTYGICEGTGKPIGKPRLEAQPWARHSIEYARQTQRPMGMGRVG